MTLVQSKGGNIALNVLLIAAIAFAVVAIAMSMARVQNVNGENRLTFKKAEQA